MPINTKTNFLIDCLTDFSVGVFKREAWPTFYRNGFAIGAGLGLLIGSKEISNLKETKNIPVLDQWKLLFCYSLKFGSAVSTLFTLGSPAAVIIGKIITDTMDEIPISMTNKTDNVIAKDNVSTPIDETIKMANGYEKELLPSVPEKSNQATVNTL